MAVFSEQYIDDYRIRRATLDDLVEVMATHHADDDAHIGFQVATEALLQEHLGQERCDVALDAWVAETYDGQIIATADVSGGRLGHGLARSVAVDPAHAGRGLEDALVTIVQARARQIADLACADECARLGERGAERGAAMPLLPALRTASLALVDREVRPALVLVHRAGTSATQPAAVAEGVAGSVRGPDTVRHPYTRARRARGRQQQQRHTLVTCAGPSVCARSCGGDAAASGEAFGTPKLWCALDRPRTDGVAPTFGAAMRHVPSAEVPTRRVGACLVDAPCALALCA